MKHSVLFSAVAATSLAVATPAHAQLLVIIDSEEYAGALNETIKTHCPANIPADDAIKTGTCLAYTANVAYSLSRSLSSYARQFTLTAQSAAENEQLAQDKAKAESLLNAECNTPLAVLTQSPYEDLSSNPSRIFKEIEDCRAAYRQAEKLVKTEFQPTATKALDNHTAKLERILAH
ncbi:MAG: hypothetical protein DI551_11385 [Micavibrio aeruginosavorus]|uniref:DUF4142 domain-containing protein n=1 Tax=Micavibrio aeruginosavorus TaxID=349221 RepID=A0A2W5MYT3_9BACT|nr:MAG: hypothetical protein DI551_11385 [Micavibrio aeruginosavorus]